VLGEEVVDGAGLRQGLAAGGFERIALGGPLEIL
jgi:hypothetical protein